MTKTGKDFLIFLFPIYAFVSFFLSYTTFIVLIVLRVVHSINKNKLLLTTNIFGFLFGYWKIFEKRIFGKMRSIFAIFGQLRFLQNEGHFEKKN